MDLKLLARCFGSQRGWWMCRPGSAWRAAGRSRRSNSARTDAGRLDELPWNPDVGRIATCGRNRWRSDAGVGIRLARYAPCDARPVYRGRLLTFCEIQDGFLRRNDIRKNHETVCGKREANLYKRSRPATMRRGHVFHLVVNDVRRTRVFSRKRSRGIFAHAADHGVGDQRHDGGQIHSDCATEMRSHGAIAAPSRVPIPKFA